jgi:hypothetical protein
VCVSLTLREEHRLGVFENRVLSCIFGSKRDGVTGEWRKLHSETASVVYWLVCWPLEPEFAGSIPAEAVGFFRCGKNPQACLPSEGK